jgi:hypothetical protein
MNYWRDPKLKLRDPDIEVAIYLFVYDLFNDSVSRSDYIASNDRMVNDQFIVKDMKGNQRS